MDECSKQHEMLLRVREWLMASGHGYNGYNARIHDINGDCAIAMEYGKTLEWHLHSMHAATERFTKHFGRSSGLVVCQRHA